MSNIALTIALVVGYGLSPAAVLWLCKRYSFPRKVGPILILYLAGALAGNAGIIPEEAYPLQDVLTTLLVPLAIPLMLFSCDFKRWDVRNAVLTLVTGVVSVV
ncbi:MAG: DUF819 family protein, partial [Odoribacteraceae bacterium]|nr:DUF819 family protein [Odoribacteraceae bacterium]